MKKINLLLGFLLFFSIYSFSQVYVNKININNLSDVKYCQINTYNTRGPVSLDYGQKNSFLKSNYVTDEKGFKIRFNSTMHFVNFMYNHGWDLYNLSLSDTNRNYLIFVKMN